MGAWRRKALELFPDLRSEIQRGDATIYTMFFELLPRCRTAHRQGDEGELEKIYGYAEWCFRQRASDLRNSAGVSFYEHLGDHPETRDEMHGRVTPSIFEDVSGLLEYRMGDEELAKIKRRYRKSAKGD